MDANTSCQPTAGADMPASTTPQIQAPQMALLDMFFPGFSVFSGAINRYLHIDLNLYIPLFLLLGGVVFAWQYFSEYFWGQLENHFMSTVDVRTDDETYNMLMSWVACQRFSQGARRFIVNTNLNSRAWCVWRLTRDDDEDDEEESADSSARRRALSYTPTFGSHYFWYKGRLLIFRRNQNRDQSAFLSASEREEISISCFGRDPGILKQLLYEARDMYSKRDERKTVIYRGTTRAGSSEPMWQRCLARTSRPFSTVILNEKVKQDLIDDVTDYLNPATRRWYSNRGIPYRRGILLYGPPGCGKSSLSLALSGAFRLPIYICSLSSVTASEENLATLFAELPRRCVVLLEDIDTAGLTHTREEDKTIVSPPVDDVLPGQVTPGTPGNVAVVQQASGRLSLSGLLNILDGVASQEGRVLIMTTNHLEKLDKALIRPGRVDRIVKFDLADRDMIGAIFRALYAPLEGDEKPFSTPDKVALQSADQAKKKAEDDAKRRNEAIAKVNALADEFADKIPAHEFSPAELQGYLLKHKRDPAEALVKAEEFVADTRKEKKEKELRTAEEKRKAEEEAKKKKQQEEEEKEKEKRKEKKKQRWEKKQNEAKKKRKAKKDGSSSSDSASSSESESDSASEAEALAQKKKEKVAADAAKPHREEKKEDLADKETETADRQNLDLPKIEEAKTGADSGYGTP